jgi:hypothetical protein
MKTETLNSYEKQAQDFLQKHRIKFRATLSDSKTPAWADGDKHGHHYRVTLSKERPTYRLYEEIAEQAKPVYRITFDFWGSIADAEVGKTDVGAYDVLACISGDANCPETFADFCGEFGYESDSIKALQTFRRVSSFAKRLQAFFTAQEIEELCQIQ